MEKPVELTYARFRRDSSGVPDEKRVFWTWRSRQEKSAWLSPSSPRFTFGGLPALYKLYLDRRLMRDDERVEEDPAMELAKVLVVELELKLFTAPRAAPDQ